MSTTERPSADDQAQLEQTLTVWADRLEKTIWGDVTLVSYARDVPPKRVLQVLADMKAQSEELRRSSAHQEKVITSLAAQRDDDSRRRKAVKQALGNGFDDATWPPGMEWEQAASEAIAENRRLTKRLTHLETRIEMRADAKENHRLRTTLTEIGEMIGTPEAAVSSHELMMLILNKINATLDNLPETGCDE